MVSTRGPRTQTPKKVKGPGVPREYDEIQPWEKKERLAKYLVHRETGTKMGKKRGGKKGFKGAGCDREKQQKKRVVGKPGGGGKKPKPRCCGGAWGSVDQSSELNITQKRQQTEDLKTE